MKPLPKERRKRGFDTKRDALDYERQKKLNSKKSMDMKLSKFMEVYFEDKQNDLKERTIKNNSITKTYYRTDKKDVITEPKTKQSVRVIEIPQFLTQEIKDFIEGTLSEVGASCGADEGRYRSYGKAEGNQSDEI